MNIPLLIFLAMLILLLGILLIRRKKGSRPSDFKESELAIKLKGIFKGKEKKIFEEIERILIESDIGAATAYDLLDEIKQNNEKIKDYSALKELLRSKLSITLKGSERSLEIKHKSTILIYGVNGVGKTTTIAKLTKYLADKGKRVALVAGDTYRAAAKEQLDVWAKRLNVKIYMQQHGADPGAVIFDGITAFKNNNNLDVLIIDTGGRLHTNDNLIKQFQKIVNVIIKAWGKLPDEAIMVLDGTTGQNGLSQVNIFSKVIEPTGFIMTKLDGTAKGGILIQLYEKYKIPILFLGTGESFSDLQEFHVEQFLNNIL